MKTVYLAGTISPAPEHLEWRKRVKEWAVEGECWGSVRCLTVDPCDRNNMRNVTADGLHDTTMPDSLFVRADVADIERADVVMVVYWKARPGLQCVGESASGEKWEWEENAAGLRRQSIGTWAEFGMAAYLGKPIVVVSDDPSVVEHPFVRTLAAGIYSTLEEGLKALEVLVR